MKYRIITYGSSYEVQYHRWWWPFWSVYYWPGCGGMLSTSFTLTEAKSRLKDLKAGGPDPATHSTVVYKE